MQIKGILSFPTLLQPKPVRDAQGNPTGEAKFSAALLLPPNDPQVAAINAAVNTAIADTFPNGFPTKADKCFMPYDEKYRGKDYYDPKFSGWWVFSCTAKADDKPTLVDAQLNPIMDPSVIFGGQPVWLHVGISGYTKGTGGVGGWLNGVMFTGEDLPMGRLDNKPDAAQMFANLPQSHQQHLAAGAHVAANGATITMSQTQAPTPPAPPAPVPPKPAATLLLTPAAGVGMTLEKMYEAGWTDEMMIQNGYAVRPSFV